MPETLETLLQSSLYTDEHRLFRQTFRQFVEREVVPRIPAWEAAGLAPRALWKRMGEQGYLCPWVDPEYGGAGADFLYSAIIDEELARVGANIAVALHSDVVAPYIASYGTPEQKARWLPRCVSGDLLLAIAMTEPDAGSDLQAIRTAARRDGDHYVLNGRKIFITNGISADLVIVVARTDPEARPAHRGLSLIAVEAGTPGFTKVRNLHKLGAHGQDTAELLFEDCRVPVANRIGEENRGFQYLMEKLQQERLVMAILSQAMAERMLEDAVRYAKARVAFGQPVASFQHSQFKIAEMATELALGRAFLDALIAAHMRGEDVVTRVSMAKWWIGEMANRVAYHCLQLHGGYGYMEEYPIARFYRDVRFHTIAGGTTEIMKTIIARRLGL
ncbi:acyl-CoA dehydrogenase family protein [Caldinitratiruptor microaerophilus]|uniref:Acyl-[acyl-carrier-protein] dehydrogenase MbtN n=1 Tax=Caldinitratiruptor microaerophilus TaxID=671077 RepID=A0AA35CJF6_9FIRM|nr:acyl-CoA dehydrogenase family protein [Caldinitratiruptor microaerophilus]BDG59574.1 acyl-CoA dehydrogenase [Caldinitratiruptor microaerophilus]